MIKGILFDYGGTIDTNGIHWAEVIWEHYRKYELPLSKEDFLQAYRFGERALAANRVIEPAHSFYDVMVYKTGFQFEWLRENGINLPVSEISSIADDCAYFAEYAVQRALPVLKQLAQSYPLVIVSNFYGNLSTILRDFGILSLFSAVIESAVAGVRKPDPHIYRLGVEALGCSPAECVVVGDSYSKDVVPAKQAGCRAVWLKGTGFSGDEQPVQPQYRADIVISDLSELLPALEGMQETPHMTTL